MLCGITSEPIMFIYAIGYNSLNSLAQDLLVRRMCEESTGDPTCGDQQPQQNGSMYLNEHELEGGMTDAMVLVQEKTAQYIMIMGLLVSSTTIATSQWTGYLLDRYPQRLIMLSPMVGIIFANLVFVLVDGFKELPTQLVFLAALFAGGSGGMITIKASVAGYITNSLPPSQWTIHLSMMEASMFLGGAVNMLSVQAITYITPDRIYLFIVAEAVTLLGVVYILTILVDDPRDYDDLSKGYRDDKAKKKESDVNVAGRIVDALRTTFKSRNNGARAMIVAVCVAQFIGTIAIHSEIEVLFLYLRYMIDWELPEFSLYFATECAVNGASLLLLLPLLKATCRPHDTVFGAMSGLSRFAYSVFLSMLHWPQYAYIGPFLGMFSMYIFPTGRAVTASLVPLEEQGRVFTILTSFEELASVCSYFIYGNAYPYFLAHKMPGVVFLIAAACGIITTAIYVGLYCSMPKNVQNEVDAQSIHCETSVSEEQNSESNNAAMDKS